jgi:hypothetical protein
VVLVMKLPNNLMTSTERIPKEPINIEMEFLMDFINNFPLQDIATFLLIMVGVGLVVAVILAAWVFTVVRRINLPPYADFFETLRHTPFSVVLLLDVLDLALDFFAAPISWVILGKLGLTPLKAVTVIEALVPGTSLLPTMTIAWVVSRLLPDLRIPTGALENLRRQRGEAQTAETRRRRLP